MTLTAKQIDKYADVLIWGLTTARANKFKKYDVIMIRYDQPALALATALHQKLVQKKYNVIIRGISSPQIEKDFYACSDKQQRSFINAGEEPLAKTLNGSIYLRAPESLTHLKSIEPKRIAETAVSRKQIRDILNQREESGDFGWTLCTYPTAELASQAGLSLNKYSSQVIKACYLESPDPVKKWGQIYQDALKIKKWLNNLPIDTINVSSKNTDLEIKLGDKRRFMGVSGHNIPSFEIFTSPDWRGTRGVYYADFPSFRSGNLVKGVKLEFKNGRVIRSSARQGSAFVKKMIGMDAGAAQIGEFSLTDKRFSRIDSFMADTLYDENIGGNHGNCHIAIGMSYADTYSGDPKKFSKAVKEKLGFNDSALHWDLVNTEKKTVTARLKTGKTITIYDDGVFKY